MPSPFPPDLTDDELLETARSTNEGYGIATTSYLEELNAERRSGMARTSVGRRDGSTG